MQPILDLKNLTFSYHSKEGETKALDNLTFCVNEGDFVGLVGPSGCGKTTILNLLAGIISPSSGDILLNGEQLNLSLNKVALMPQRDQLFEWRTIERNIMLGLEIRRNKNKQNKELALNLLKKYGLEDFSKMHPSQLSGGMKQRAALIRTLVTQPEILLLDEPFSALDYQTRLNVCDDVYRIIKQEKKTALLVSHDISECISLCDKIVVLSHRPTKVKEEITIEINKDLTPLKRREDKLFTHYFEKIWILLEEKKNDG
jgi:NitT/TauT family transport system ATP-binding protein